MVDSDILYVIGNGSVLGVPGPVVIFAATAPRAGAIGLANGAGVRFFYLPIQVLPNSIWG
jgi:hypothetical protein